jgi:hypothetical protein
MSDFMVADHGSIVILQPVSATALDWLDENIGEDAMRWGPKGVVIERRYWPAIYEGLKADGLTVS